MRHHFSKKALSPFAVAIFTLLTSACGQQSFDALSIDANANTGSNASNIGSESDLTSSLLKFQKRFSVSDMYTRLVVVDNPAKGFEMLFGTRNFRSVLNGLVYRGGVNHSTTPGYEWPLAKETLDRLCKEGFEHIVYLYRDTQNAIIPVTSCVANDGRPNVMKYEYISPFNTSGAKKLQTIIHDKLNGQPNSGPIYLHCHDGHHASGLVSALALRQFCGFSAVQALSYWNKATDGEDGSQFDDVRERVVSDRYLANLPPINEKIRRLVCPSAE